MDEGVRGGWRMQIEHQANEGVNEQHCMWINYPH